MDTPPITKQEAEKATYGGRWKLPYKEGRCAWPVYDCASRRYLQCSNENGHGPDNLFCKGHSYGK